MPNSVSLRATRASRLMLATLITASFTACASAAYRTPLAGTDRPGYSFGTATVPLGGMQAEVGYTDTRAGSLTYQTLGEGLLRIGAGPTTELRVFSNSYALRRDGGIRDDGMEDAKIGVKQRLWAGRAASGLGSSSVALMAGTSIPTGAVGFGADAWQPEALLAAALPLNAKLSLVPNVGDVYARLGSERAHRLLGSLAAWYTVSSRLGVFGEWGGSRLADDASSHLNYLDAGFAIVPVPALQLDLRVGHGMNGMKNDNYVGAGIVRRW
jgi:hypothetical protein